MSASYIFTLSLLILVAVPTPSAGENRTTSAQFDRRSDAVTRFQAALDAYVAQRYQTPDAESEGSFCLSADVEDEEVSWTPYEGAFFFPEISHVIRERAANALRDQHKDAHLSAMTREALRAPSIRVNETLPPDAGGVSPPWLAAVLPVLPRELAYRQVGLDLVLIEAASKLVVDVLRDAVFAH